MAAPMGEDLDAVDVDRQPRRRILERSLAWYWTTVFLPLVPLAAVWGVTKAFGPHPLGWIDLLGKGELLIAAIPVSAMAIASMHAATGIQASGTSLVVLIALVLLNAFALLWLGAFAVSSPNDSGKDMVFIIVSALFFAATAVFGLLAIRLAHTMDV